MLKFLRLCWMASVLVMAAAASEDSKEESSSPRLYLYKDDPDADGAVDEYTGTEGRFEESTHPRVVEFYSPYCPACEHFKPKYILKAEKMQAKHENVEFYAVSCAAHKDMCKKYKISAFPSILTFRESSQHPKVLSQKTVAGIEDALHLTVSTERRKLEREDDEGEEIAGKDTDGSPDEEKESSPQDSEDLKEEEESEDKSGDIKEKGEEQEEEESEDKSGDEKKVMGSGEDKAEEEESEDKSGDENKVMGSGEDKAEKEESEDKSGDEKKFMGSDRDKSGDKEEMDSKEDREQEDSKKSEDASPEEKESEDKSEDPYIRPEKVIIPMKKKGAIAARDGHRDMDQWREIMRKKLQERERLKKEQRGFGRGYERKVPKKYSRVIFQPGQVREGATDVMKAHVPGTPEFEARREEIRKRVARLKKKHMRKPRRDDSSSVTGRPDGYPGKLGRLPYKKEITKPRVVEKLPVVKRFTHMSYEEELILDASLSFLQGLKFGIFTSDRPLTNEKKRVLRDWLDLMAISLPSEWGLHDIIDALRSDFEYVSQADKNMEKVLMSHPLPRITWSKSCSNSAGGGFTCGFWKLLHIVTIGVAEHKGGQNLINAKLVRPNAKVFSPLEAADTLRAYIGNFFTCEECRQHFIRHYDNCDRNRRCDRLTDDETSATDADWKELSKWLWEFHNEVNVRLMNERAHRERMKKMKSSWNKESGPGHATMQEEISVLWPNLEQCILCFREDGTWNEDAVFVYLEKTYWPDSSDDPKADRLLKFEDDDTPYGARLTMFLVCVGVVLLYLMRQSLTKSGLQQTVLMARTLRPKGAVGANKRSV